MGERGHESLIDAFWKIPLFDHHCHNIVETDSELAFEQCFSEASGAALKDVVHTLAFKRDVKEIAAVLGCAPTLRDVVASRAALGTRALAERFFSASNISALLLDDGLALDKMLDLRDHLPFAPIVKRVLRVETIAEWVLSQNRSGLSLDEFRRQFVAALDPLPEGVVAFKSIACYRSGLDIDPNVTEADGEAALKQELLRLQGKESRPRISAKPLVDFVFVLSLEIATKHNIPMQLHTGFGDNDVDIRLANPAHLKRILEEERFATSCIVLLHASYPYMKEASFLCSVYPQVYIDSGLAVPKLSVRAMQNALHDLISLAPLNKLMASTDAFAFPEGYYTGAKWTREVLARVLNDVTADGDLSADEALEAARAILHDNAARLYRLPGTTPVALPGTQPSPSPLLSGDKSDDGFVRLLYCDVSGQRRTRVIPSWRYASVESVGVGMVSCLNSLQSWCDGPAPGSGLTAVGETRMIPDTSTRRKIPWMPEQDFVLTTLYSTPGVPFTYCPRWALQRQLEILDKEFGLSFRVGFEAEFYLLKSVPSGRPEDGTKLVGVDTSLYCSSTAFNSLAPILSEVTSALKSLGVPIEQLHAESGKGQYEISMVYAPALQSADNLLLLRETVTAIAQKHDLTATFLPKYSEFDAGSGGHVHMSLWDGATSAMASADEDGMSPVARHFFAGVLEHLPALLAFTTPHPNSYFRMQPNCWAGVYQVWGVQNREAPLRVIPFVGKSEVSNIELKAIDGCANPHLALAAILTAGMDGLRRKTPLPPPTEVNPSILKNESELRLPPTLGAAVTALESDVSVFRDALGSDLIDCVIALRKAEHAHFSDESLSFEAAVKSLMGKF